MSRKQHRKAQSAPHAKPVAIPVSPRTAWRLIIGSFAVVGLVAAIIWAVAAGVPRNISMAAATAGSKAGFVVRQVDIEGASNQPRLSIYREVLEGGSDSMLLIDLPAIRGRLKELEWVKDAEVRRRWPDRLEISIEERKPAALWQAGGRMNLIDADGIILPVDDISRFSGMPLVVGAGAQHQAATLLKIIASQPQLVSEIEAAQWVGSRRWDLRMKSGETVSLPEGDAAHAAYMRFAEVHRQTPLLNRGFIRFDLRLPDKMVVRVATDPGVPVKPRVKPEANPQLPPSQVPAQPQTFAQTQTPPQPQPQPQIPPQPQMQTQPKPSVISAQQVARLVNVDAGVMI